MEAAVVSFRSRRYASPLERWNAGFDPPPAMNAVICPITDSFFLAGTAKAAVAPVTVPRTTTRSAMPEIADVAACNVHNGAALVPAAGFDPPAPLASEHDEIAWT